MFPSTHWSLLARATLDGESQGRAALDELCRRYWSPLRQFIRLRGCAEAEAEDLTQEFLLHVLEHATLHKADRVRGKFRTFLLGALVRFLGDERDRRQALKRGGGATHISLATAEEASTSQPAADAGIFDREWAVTILENALRQVRQEFASGGDVNRFEVLQHFLPGTLQVPSYEDAAAQLAMSLPAFKSEVHRLRQRFRTIVRQEVASTVSAPHELDEEVDYLGNVLMDKGSDLSGPKLSPPIP